VDVHAVPTFAIAGAARAGSTALAEAVRQHPDGFVCQPKEPHYYALAHEPLTFAGPGDDATINRVAITGRKEFLDLFAGTQGRVARGDGSVSTLYYYERSIPEIRKINPDMRIVIVLRNPVERAYSSFQYLRVRGFEPLDDFLTAVGQETKRRRANWHHLWHYTSMSYYAKSVAAFLSEFGSERVHVLLYDELKEDPAGSVGALHQFLGLKPEPGAADLARVNASGDPRLASLQRAIAWASRHEALRAGLKHFLPFAVREKIRSANLQPQTATPREFAELGPIFRDDIRELQDILGRSLLGWLRSEHEGGRA
jgi:sulfotransferase family protein